MTAHYKPSPLCSAYTDKKEGDDCRCQAIRVSGRALCAAHDRQARSRITKAERKLAVAVEELRAAKEEAGK
jgi:hypothetical protein